MSRRGLRGIGESNGIGQLWDGTTTDHNTLVQVSGLIIVPAAAAAIPALGPWGVLLGVAGLGALARRRKGGKVQTEG